MSAGADIIYCSGGAVMKAGVSTACLYPTEVEKAFKRLAENGVRSTEIFVNTHSELFDPYLSEMLAVRHGFDMEVTSVHPFTCGIEPMMLFTRYERRVDDMLDYYKRFFEYMDLFGAKFFILHGNKPTNRCEDEVYFERFFRLQETARSFGVEVLQENVSRCTAGDMGFLMKMKDQLGENAAFVLDTKQALRAGNDPIQMVKALGSSIKHLHFSDSGKNGDCLKFGFGEYDNFSLFKEMQDCGYSGSVMIELYQGNFEDAADLAENYRVLEKYLEDNGF